MIKKVLSTDKFDPTYKKDTSAVWGAIIISIIYFIALNNLQDKPDGLKVILLILHIICAIWSYSLAEKLKLEPIGLSVLALFFPVVILFILGISKKRSLAFNIDTSYSEEKQLEELRKYAKGFSDKGRFSDAASVYKYIVQHLNGTEEDGKTYIDLQNKITI